MDFLFEIGLEEIPARMIAGAQAELLKRTTALLERERLVVSNADANSYSTPRRLAVLVSNVAERQPDLTEELLGPAAKIAFKDGIPTPAAIAFARKAGIPVEDLRTVETPKGEYLAATALRPGRAAAEVLAAELPKELAAIYWAKNMYWRTGKPERFVRPVRWLLALLGDAVVPVSFGGFEAGRVTFGHRVLHGPGNAQAPIQIPSPAAYLAALTAAFVMADVELRRHTIRKALDRVCRSIPAGAGGASRWREDHTLVDKMTHMTEWPSVIAGAFEPDYLTLPDEVLVTVMRDHQNYFAVEQDLLSSRSAAEGSASSLASVNPLAPHFLAVLNTAPTPEGEAVIRHGNERVLRARFNDARFFWDFDQRIPLLDRVALLENVTFQKDLGSYAAKSDRVRTLALRLAEPISGVDQAALEVAAILSKTDLTTELVKEFTELQGEIGGLYARDQGIAEAACAAIYDHYRPASMDDRIPRTVEGQLLSIADKADTIAGMFSLGLEPTGSKDPFALRRAANGIVKILAESGLSLTLGKVAFAAAPAAEGTVDKMELFFAERLDFYLREAKSQAYDVVKAVLAAGANDVRDAVARAQALTAVRDSADFAAVSAAFKRMKNILTQANEKGTLDMLVEIPTHVEMHPAQRELTAAAGRIGEAFARLTANHEYVAALELIATLRPQVDVFFQQVMVMDGDPCVRQTRLNLLSGLVQTFSRIADFSEIVTPG